MFYANSKEAFKELEQGHLDGEENRTIALRYILLSPEYSYKFVKSKLYKSPQELKNAIKRVLRNSIYSAKILIQCNEVLTKHERNRALLIALDDWESTYLLLKCYDLCKESRKRAINMIIMSAEHIKKFIQHCKHSNEERMLILSAFGDNYDVLQIFIKCIRNGTEREIAFKILLKSADEIYIAAYNKRLNAMELKTVYNRHSSYYFNKFKRNFRCYYTYCSTFKGLLSKHEEEVMVNKLRNAKYRNFLPHALEEMKFSFIGVEVLHSIMVANKLMGKNKQN